MRSLVVFFVSLVTLILISNFSVQAQVVVESARETSPWQLSSISDKADQAVINNRPNSNEPNIKFSYAHYKRAAKKAMKEAKKSVKKAEAVDRPKTHRDYEKKYFQDAKAAGVNIKKNRRNS